MKIYGIKNCNTMKKAFDLLESKGIAYEFVDYKKQKPSTELLEKFSEKLGFESLVNKKGTTYRQLSEEENAQLTSKDTAFPLLSEKSSMLKRPIFEYADGKLSFELV